MKRRNALVAIVAVVVVTLGLYLPLTLLAPLGAAQVDVHVPAFAPSKAVQPAWPAFGESAFGEVGDDSLLQVSGTSAPLPIASISKLVMALVVLEAKPLGVGEEGPTITFSQADHDLAAKDAALDGTIKPMPVGATMSERQVLQVALIASANNYAQALADWAFGSETAYAATATSWLAAHHLGSTTIVEPTGLNPANTSTATDLVALGKIALANPVIAPIVDTPTLTLPVVGDIKDTNRLLGQQGIIGIKTGTLSTSSLLFASRFRISGHTTTVVGAVLGAPDRDTLYPAVSALLASITSGFHAVTVATKGQVLATYTTAWGQKAQAVASSTATIVVWSDRKVSADVLPAPLRLARTGAPAGTATFTDGHSSAKLPLHLAGALTDPGPVWRLAHPFSAFPSG